MQSNHTKILNAASELFLEKGISALSVRAISKKAGLSTIGIYSYFKGKQGILDALFIEGCDIILQQFQQQQKALGTLESVIEISRGYLNIANNYGAHYRLVFGESGDGYKPSEDAVLAGDKVFQEMLKIISAYIKREGFVVDPEVVSMDIWAILHGYVSISLHRSDSFSGWDWNTLTINAVNQYLRALN